MASMVEKSRSDGQEGVLRPEDVDFEVKAAQGRNGHGAVPKDFWPTYSAMANTDGGEIWLGVKERIRGHLEVIGVPKIERVRKELCDALSNREKVSPTLWCNDDVQVRQRSRGLPFLVVRVPRAARSQRPVFIHGNPLRGTYRRGYEGDYLCDDQAVRRMMAEAGQDSRDADLLEYTGLDDLDVASLAAYRNLFRSTKPGHPWLPLDDLTLLEKLGGAGFDRVSGKRVLTRAGLLMFGELRAIWNSVPYYLVDYQEKGVDADKTRYIDRITTDGMWSGNLFDFYQRVYLKLVADLKVPFAFRPGTTTRQDETPVHEGLREALVNALIHADYGASTGILVIKEPHGFSFRNPGGLRMPAEQAMTGGSSDCRNRNLQKMFQMIGEGEQAGSGLPRILAVWSQQHWRTPLLTEMLVPEYTTLQLPMASLLPEWALADLKARFGSQFNSLPDHGRLAVATAFIEGRVNNERLRRLASLHPADATVVFDGLVGKHLLVPEKEGRWRYYRLPRVGEEGVVHVAADEQMGTNPGPSRDQVGTKSEPSGDQVGTKSAPSHAQAGTKSALSRHQVEVLDFAKEPRTSQEIMVLLGRHDRTKFRAAFIAPLLDAGLLQMTIPDKPNSRLQQYVVTPAGLAELHRNSSRGGSN